MLLNVANTATTTILCEQLTAAIITVVSASLGNHYIFNYVLIRKARIALTSVFRGTLSNKELQHIGYFEPPHKSRHRFWNSTAPILGMYVQSSIMPHMGEQKRL